jgi:hypothetical protein
MVPVNPLTAGAGRFLAFLLELELDSLPLLLPARG